MRTAGRTLLLLASGLLATGAFAPGLFALAAPSADGPGVLKTDGMRVDGPISLSNGLITVSPGKGAAPVTVPLDQVRQADFDPPPLPPTGWLAEYYENDTFTKCLLGRREAEINFHTDQPESLAPGIPATFAARFSGVIDPPYTETYQIAVLSDDGIRVWIDNKPVIDRWSSGQREASGTVQLTAHKRVPVRVDYNNSGGATAIAQVQWSSPRLPLEFIAGDSVSPPDDASPAGQASGTQTLERRRNALRGRGLRGDYFANQTIQGEPAMSRRDGGIDFDWGDRSPSPKIPPDHFAIRWTGKITPPADGAYRFAVSRDNGVRIWIDGQLLFDNWRSDVSGMNGVPPEVSKPVALRAGHASEFKLEYYEEDGGAMVHLQWEGPNLPRQIVPATAFTPPNPQSAPPAVEIDASCPRYFPRPAGVRFSARCLADKSSPIKQVEFVVDGKVAATATSAPFAADWPDAAPGAYTLRARATDKNGAVAESDPVRFAVGGGGSAAHPLPDVLAQLRVAPAAPAAPADEVDATGPAGTIDIKTAGGTLSGTTDRCQFVYAPVTAAAEVTVGLVTIAGGDATFVSSAGVMIRTSLSADAAMVALVANRDGSATCLVRNTAGQAVSERQIATAPKWMRLTKRGGSVDLQGSDDGAKWTVVVSESLPVEAGDTVFAGLAAAGAGDDAVRFHVENFTVTASAARMAFETAGARMTDGQFIAGHLRNGEANGLRLYHDGVDLRLAPADVAEVALQPLTQQRYQALADKPAGALLANGDIADGEFDSIKDGQINLLTPLFGLVSISPRDAIYIKLHDTPPPPSRKGTFEIETTDGSRFYVTPDRLRAAGPASPLRVTCGANEISINSADIRTIRQPE